MKGERKGSRDVSKGKGEKGKGSDTSEGRDERERERGESTLQQIMLAHLSCSEY